MDKYFDEAQRKIIVSGHDQVSDYAISIAREIYAEAQALKPNLEAEIERLKAENGGIANAAELLAEDIECVHMWLDDRNVPRFCELTDLEYSIVGRVALLCYGREEKGQIDHLKSQIVNESFD